MTDQITVVIDATELDDYELCNFKWYATQKLGLTSKYPNKPMDGGSLLHYTLEQYYTMKRDSMEPMPEIIEKCVELTRIKALEFDSLEASETTDTIFQFRAYAQYYENESWLPVYIEQPFMFVLYEDLSLKIIITGKPDLVFRYAGTNSLGICDHKRSGRAYDYSPLRNQFMLYCTALNIDTFIVNKVGFQKTVDLKDRMKRQSFTYHPEILAEWKEDTIFAIKEMIIKDEGKIYAKNRTSCEKFNGCFLQRYCITRPEAREFLIGTEYALREKWDVTASLNNTTITEDSSED